MPILSPYSTHRSEYVTILCTRIIMYHWMFTSGEDCPDCQALNQVLHYENLLSFLFTPRQRRPKYLGSSRGRVNWASIGGSKCHSQYTVYTLQENLAQLMPVDMWDIHVLLNFHFLFCSDCGSCRVTVNPTLLWVRLEYCSSDRMWSSANTWVRFSWSDRILECAK
jgi:hypothetical protein